MKKLLLLLLLFRCTASFAQNDSIDVFSYHISIDTVAASAHTIKAHTDIRFGVVYPSISSVEFSLQQLIVDSVIYQNQQLNFTTQSFHQRIMLLSPAQPGDTIAITVYYHGTPAADPSGWGGVYFSGTYFFNMGVGFQSDPHNFGRAWFPCNDNFTDRAYYSFSVRTHSNEKAFCNGLLTSQQNNPDGTITWQWNSSQRMPTYLASVAVAPYYTLRRTSNGIPVEWACLPADTNNVLSTFQNLDTILAHYISSYGPYPFDKVGYCLIPFNSGAMEHASSIHIGRAFVNGSLTYETLWAHELSHMWFGDQVTCASQEEMWLNEGFASFNESMVTEWLYGVQAYRDWHRANHRKVLQFAHITDAGYHAMNVIPFQYTYGPTVYNKGAEVARTIRGYLGDSLFFSGLRDYFVQMNDSSATSADLRDELTASSGISMTRFFDDWVFTAGFPHFDIDSIREDVSSPGQYLIATKQKSKGNSHVYAMPVDVLLSDGVNDTTVTLMMDSTVNLFRVNLAFTPSSYTVDPDDKMADAITSDQKIITGAGGQTFSETNTNMTVINAGAGNSTMLVEHHWVAPDPFKAVNPGIRLSDYHYWRIDGNFAAGLNAKVNFLYNGSTSTSAGYLDNTLITATEDSLVILYRADASDDWHLPASYFVQKSGNALDKVGYISVDTIRKGEYTFGYYDVTSGIGSVNDNAGTLHVAYDPHTHILAVIIPSSVHEGTFNVYSSAGQLLYSREINSNIEIQWNKSMVSDSIYIATVTDVNGRKWSTRF